MCGYRRDGAARLDRCSPSEGSDEAPVELGAVGNDRPNVRSSGDDPNQPLELATRERVDDRAAVVAHVLIFV